MHYLEQGGWDLVVVTLKIRGKEATERSAHFLRKAPLLTAHSNNTPESRMSCAVQQGPRRLSAPFAKEPLQEYCLQCNSTNGEELTANHNDSRLC